MPVAGRDLEAFAFEADGAVTSALLARGGAAKGPPQRLTVRAVAPHTGGIEKALEWRCADLAMQILMVFLFHPGLGDGVEPFQGEFGHAFEHRHQTPFHGGPEGLLFGILILMDSNP